MAEKEASGSGGLEHRRLEDSQRKVGAVTDLRSAVEVRRLLHELEVHQVELENQNAELSRARGEVERVLEMYADLYDFAPVGYLTLARGGTILNINLTGASLLGLERSRLKGRRFQLFVAEICRPCFASFLDKVFANCFKETVEVILIRVGASRLSVQIEAVSASSGKECRVALIDVTERKQAEEAQRKVEEAAGVALQELEEAAGKALRKLEESEALPREEGEAVEGLHRRVAEAAKEARRRVEETAREARLKVTEAAKVAETLQREHKVTKTALVKVNEFAEAARMKMEQVSETAFRNMETAAELQKGRLASEILRQDKVLAEAATMAKSQFLANMSHELRTPMTGVIGMLDLALSGDLGTEQREFIIAAHASAHSLVRILNDILDLTKIELGKLSIEEKPFFVRECVEATYKVLLPLAKSKGLEFKFTVADDLPQAMLGDQTRLNQVLTNLTGNAVKFTEKGKVEIRVSAVSSTPDGRRNIVFTVTDTGIGIADDKKHLLFHSFSQVDESHSRVYGGTGLGLAISKELVERMGGSITFASGEGEGSVFSFSIPLAEALRKSDTQFPSTETASPAPEAEDVRRLLLAEDDATIREFLGRMLAMANYKVDVAENGMVAVEMWEKGEYDLVLMDVQMPLLNGFEATGAIREKERQRGCHTPIIAMTAHASREDKQQCLAAGMDDFIPKPIDFNKSLQVIRDLIRGKSVGL